MEKPRPPDATLVEQKGERATETFATINGCERFAHPLTGFEMPEEVHFAPRSAVLIDNGCAHCPPRGILHYLATGGGDLVNREGNGEYVNPGDTAAWLHELDRRIAALRASVDENNAEMMELNTVIHDQQSRIPLTHEQVLEVLAHARHGLASVKRMEEHLASVTCLSDPVPGQIDDVRRAIFRQRKSVDESIQKAKESEEQLKRLEILQQREQKLNVETPIQMAELQRLSSNRDFIARNGLVTVTSSGWQQGVVHDVLSDRPKYSWSKYHWDADSSPSHPEGKAAGAWCKPPVHRRVHCYMHSCLRSDVSIDRCPRKHTFEHTRSCAHKHTHTHTHLHICPRETHEWEVVTHMDTRFQVQLPEGLALFPTHYALRHGDDGCATAPALRHDANCASFQLASETPPGERARAGGCGEGPRGVVL